MGRRYTYDDMASVLQGRTFMRLNHEQLDRTCVGRSNSSKLEVDEDAISFFCWRCGRHALYPHPGSARARLGQDSRPEVLEDLDDKKWKREWPGGSTDLLNWPPDVLAWATKVLDVAMVRDSGMAWDQDRERLWLPVCLDGVPVKWNGRKFRTDGPKYLTGKVQDYRYHDAFGEDRSVILTEDIVGAMRLAHSLETRAYPILGVSIDYQSAQRLSEGSQHVVIWLDNDNAQVMKARRKLVKLFDSLGCSVTLYRGAFDPKREPRLLTGPGLSELTQELNI